MATLEQRITALELKAKRAAQYDDRPWDVIFAEVDAQMTEDLKNWKFEGDPMAFLDAAEKYNNAQILKKYGEL